MKLSKTLYPLLLACICFVLLSGCTANNSSSSVKAGGNTLTATSTVRSETHTSTATSTVSSTTLPADCPAAGTTRAVNLPTNTSVAQPAVFYLTAWGGVQSGINSLDLMRYDLTTGKTTSIFSFAGTTVGVIPQIQLSPNKHWLLITKVWKLNNNGDVSSVQLIRTDGTQLHTLACSSSVFGWSANWLSDGQRVAITKTQYNQQQNEMSYTVEVLNLATGKSQTVLSGDYAPYAWLDEHRLLVDKTTGTNSTTTDFFLFDTNNGPHQKLTDLKHVASFPTWGSFVYGNIAVSSDRSQLFTSSFTQAKTNPGNCQGPTSQGPGTLNSYAISGGSTHAIYSSKSLAILAIQPVSNQTLLIYIENTMGDLSQNGLWKINTDGTGLTRLTTAHDHKCQDLGYSELLPQIASNGQSYALELTDFTQRESPSIVVGNLSGGTPTTIATKANVLLPKGKDGFDSFLQLVGMA